MKNKFLSVGAIGCLTMLVGATTLGCGSTTDRAYGSNGAICDVDFADLAGTYSFKMTMGRTDYINSCFEDFDNPNPTDPAAVTNCTWSEQLDTDTITVELVVTEDGNIGSGKVVSVTENGETENINVSVNCEMLQGELCDAPVRCTFSGDKCEISPTSDPDAWKYDCNCLEGGMNDPMGQACQTCKASYDKYQAERNTYCQQERDSQYIEFTLNVK
jgi:hypothetical protein